MKIGLPTALKRYNTLILSHSTPHPVVKQNYFLRFLKPLTPYLALLFLCIAESASAQIWMQDKLPTVSIGIGKIHIEAEVANTDQTRQIGLMGRQHMGKNKGMLFVFGSNHIQCMWMKNTLIDLDVAFLDEQGHIINIESMLAGSTQIHCAKKPVKLALEMNKGWFKNNHIHNGFKLSLPTL